MEIDLFYFDGCPSWQEGLENLNAALSAEGLEASIRLVKVTDDDEAATLEVFRLAFISGGWYRLVA